MSKTILTVDDASTIRKMIAFTLKPTGHTIVEAQDGVDALTQLQRHRVDLVITDVNMPNMNGIELTRQIRLLPAYRSVPVLLLTTESDPEKKNQGRAAGATGWLTKPFQPDQLLSVINRVLPA